jgi:GAF domain-containing protein
MELTNKTPTGPHLLKVLAALNQIGQRINRLGVGQDVAATLKLIVENAVEVVAAGAEAATVPPNASAVIWIYDPIQQAFEANSRVSAGEPAGASTQDQPRVDGLGSQAIQQRRRILSYQEQGQTIHPAKQAAGAKSLACYPIIVNNEVVGALYVYRCDEQPFNPVELLLLDNFVNLAALAIHHGRQLGGMTRSLTRKVRELEKLGRASQLVSSRTNVEATLQEILSIGLDLTGAQYGSFELYDKKSGLLSIKALAGPVANPERVTPLPVDEQSVVGWVATRRESVLIPDLQQSPWVERYQPLPVDRPMRSELAVPLLGAGGMLEGVLNIESPQLCAFTLDDRRTLETLAAQTVIALQEMRLLDTLQEIVGVLLASDLDELLKRIIDRACELINVPVASIWTIAGANTLLLRQSTAGHRRGERLPLDRSFTGKAIRLHRSIVIDDVRLDPDFLHPELAVQQGWVSAIVVPLLMPDETHQALGSFSLYATQLRDFSDWDIKLLTVLANHAAVAIQGAEQLGQLKQARERQATAEALAAVGDVAANLMHQLNNKVGAIPARVQGIEAKCGQVLATTPYLAKHLLEIEQSAQQALAIVRDSMAHLRPIERQAVDLALCLEQAIARAAPPAGIQIRQAGMAPLPQVSAGPRQVELAFYNLIDNAVKAMAGVGELTITGQQAGPEIVITIADNGPGIPLEIQPHLFEFSTLKMMPVDEPLRRLGFGLWWVKTFVDRFGGRLEVQSAPGQGSAFTIYLPVEAGG